MPIPGSRLVGQRPSADVAVVEEPENDGQPPRSAVWLPKSKTNNRPAELWCALTLGKGVMIGRIKGVLCEKNPPALLIDVGGLGYELDAPMSTFYTLPAAGEAVTLHVHMIVREDAHLLYGFATRGERSLFRSLLKVNGVGARVALAILSGMNADEFAVCIRHKDVTALTRIPGIGKKTAERLVVEMGDKLPQDQLPGGVNLDGLGPADGTPISESGASQAVAALISLGYKPVEAARLVDKTGRADDTVEDIIRAALKQVIQ